MATKPPPPTPKRTSKLREWAVQERKRRQNISFYSGQPVVPISASASSSSSVPPTTTSFLCNTNTSASKRRAPAAAAAAGTTTSTPENDNPSFSLLSSSSSAAAAAALRDSPSGSDQPFTAEDQSRDVVGDYDETAMTTTTTVFAQDFEETAACGSTACGSNSTSTSIISQNPHFTGAIDVPRQLLPRLDSITCYTGFLDRVRAFHSQMRTTTAPFSYNTHLDRIAFVDQLLLPCLGEVTGDNIGEEERATWRSLVSLAANYFVRFDGFACVSRDSVGSVAMAGLGYRPAPMCCHGEEPNYLVVLMLRQLRAPACELWHGMQQMSAARPTLSNVLVGVDNRRYDVKACEGCFEHLVLLLRLMYDLWSLDAGPLGGTTQSCVMHLQQMLVQRRAICAPKKQRAAAAAGHA